MNIEYEFRYGCACCSNWEIAKATSSKLFFYDVLIENGFNVVPWNYSKTLLTFVEIDSDNLPTGIVFQLLKRRKIVKPINGGVC